MKLVFVPILSLLLGVNLFVSAQDVRLPPSLTRGPSTLLNYRERSNVTLYCEGVGVPSLTYEWTKNGQPLSVNTGNIQMRPGVGTIDISVCLASDEGYYQCKMSNVYGGTMSNTTFLQMAVLEQFPPAQPVNVNVDLNGHVCLLCQPRLNSIPAAEIYWKYNFTGNTGKPIDVTQTSKIQTDPFTGSLCLTNVEASDGYSDRSKVYICNVENTVMQTIHQGSYSHLMTTGNTVASYGAILTFSSAATIIGLEGEEMVLRCFFSGSPVPSIIWRKDDKVFPQDRWRATHSNTGLSLNSGALIQDDAGIYTCEGSNGIGTAVKHSMEMIIQARPVFQYQPHDVNATDSEDVVITCNPRAIPDTTVRWFKNQVEFTAATLPPKMSLSADMKTLTINGVCKSCYEGGAGDLMNVQCNASNEHGYAFAQGYVNVLVATVITSDGGSRPWIAYQNEVFDCEAVTDDSTSIWHQWFYNGILIMYNEKIYVAANGSLVMLTQNDTDGGQYLQGEYKCVASNGYSEAEITYIYGGPNHPEFPIKLTLTAKSTLYEVFIDGVIVPRCSCNTAPEEIALQLHNQLIAVTAIDTTATCAGILASVTDDILVTNAEWKCTARPAPDWYTLGFDDESWSDAYVIGSNHNVTMPVECNILKGIDSISENASWIWTPSISDTPFYDYTIHCRAYLHSCDEPEPICLNGGICNKNNITLCTCLPGYTGFFCENELVRTLNITAKSVIYELFVDGIHQNLTHNDEWKTTDVIPLSLANRLVAILAADSTQTCAGILASVTEDYLVTDINWKCDVGPPPTWYLFDFDDSDWSPAYVIGANGNVTWPEECKSLDEIPTISQSANWIWTSTILDAPYYDHAIYCRAYLPYCETVRPCRNGGTCNRNSATLCSCSEGFTGIYCESLI